jgi:futalosine hydrolase
MKILITVATSEEERELKTIRSDKHEIDIAVTGVGMVSTAHELTKKLATKKYELAINAGIAGSFDRSIAIGEVVFISQDIFSELGAEDDENFLSLSTMGLTGEDSFHVKANEKFPSLNKFRNVRGITVNTVHGNEASIQKVIQRLKPEVETMEGAAFYFVCEKENVTAIQLRAISNYVERRNRDNWNVQLALRSEQEAIKQFIHEI